MEISLFPSLGLAVFAFVNSVAISLSSSAALPFCTIMVLLGMFVLVTLPLAVLGGVIGRNTAQDFDAPTRTTKVRIYCCCV
jgi:transmembrane 9 superfamily protein 1